VKILLFGRNGCFGSEMLDVCKNNKLNLASFSSKQLNINNLDKIEKKISQIKPNFIINAAAIVGINNCEENFEKAFMVNSIAALNLAKICEKKKITLIQISTHAVFDGNKKATYVENDEAKPNNVYSGTKYLSELFVKSICRKYYIIRFPSLYGKKNNVNGFFNKVIISLKKNKPLKVAYDKIDSPTYAKDASEQLLKILTSQLKYGTYHISNKGRTNYFNFVKCLKKILNSKSKIVPVKDKYFISKGFKILNASLESKKKIKNLRSWELALKEYVFSNKA
jgi:dTDP-4-dehydrorhamnose reductase|tara:strand:+ start:4302 stop:5144 length:843 start_codon:yes stop_codon:yes gene_type:complete